MKHLVKNIVKRVLYVSGYYRYSRRGTSPREKRLLVLMYHDLLEDTQSGQIMDNESPTRSQFDAHLREIVRNYRVVSLAKAVDEIKSDGGLEDDSVAVTFDDGYESVYSIAYPLLRKHGVPATVFLLTDWIGNDTPFWWHRVRDLATKSSFIGVKSRELQEIVGFPNELFQDGTKIDMDFRRQVGKKLELHLRNMSENDRQKTLDRLQERLFLDEDYECCGERALGWEQIRHMAENGMDFQAHTCTHIDMRFVDADTIEREIINSKLEIEKRIDRPVTGFAYPYGKDLESYVVAEDILRANGYLYACTAYPGINSNTSNLYSLRRGSIVPTSSTALINHDLCHRLPRTNE